MSETKTPEPDPTKWAIEAAAELSKAASKAENTPEVSEAHLRVAAGWVDLIKAWANFG